MFKIQYSFSPIRAVAGQKNPVLLELRVKNGFPETKLVSVFVKIPFSLGFDRVGLFRDTRRQIGDLAAGDEKVIPINIYPKTNIIPGDYKVMVKVFSHKDRYDKIDQEFPLTTILRVISR
jgi:hypothetical protein